MPPARKGFSPAPVFGAIGRDAFREQARKAGPVAAFLGGLDKDQPKSPGTGASPWSAEF
jgi:hypothetical protein